MRLARKEEKRNDATLILPFVLRSHSGHSGEPSSFLVSLFPRHYFSFLTLHLFPLSPNRRRQPHRLTASPHQDRARNQSVPVSPVPTPIPPPSFFPSPVPPLFTDPSSLAPPRLYQTRPRPERHHRDSCADDPGAQKCRDESVGTLKFVYGKPVEGGEYSRRVEIGGLSVVGSCRFGLGGCVYSGCVYIAGEGHHWRRRGGEGRKTGR